MRKLILLFFFGLMCSSLSGQSISHDLLSSAGNQDIGESIILNWSLGELCASSLSNGDYHLVQGFQQTNFTNTSVYEVNDFKVLIYPNPTFGEFHINLGEWKYEKWQIELLDSQGMLVMHYKFTTQEPRIDACNLPTGIYFLRILNEDDIPLKIVKLIKI